MLRKRKWLVTIGQQERILQKKLIWLWIIYLSDSRLCSAIALEDHFTTSNYITLLARRPSQKFDFLGLEPLSCQLWTLDLFFEFRIFEKRNKYSSSRCINIFRCDTKQKRSLELYVKAFDSFTSEISSFPFYLI
jgi:hypothetical protein